MRTYRTSGMTLVELLVALAIVGVLVALLLPAVQATRAAARRLTCQSHLRQIGLATHNHLNTFGRFPSGGWGFIWAPDPDRGYDRHQPGGWLYNILPFVEQPALRDWGAGEDLRTKWAWAVKLAEQPLSVVNCPGRRGLQLYPYLGDQELRNSQRPTLVAKGDYAANAGDPSCGGMGPADLAEGDGPYDWRPVTRATGVIYVRSELRLEDIPDGTSYTYLVGEKRCNTAIIDRGDDQHPYLGHGLDTARYTLPGLPPVRDGTPDGTSRFGSAHAEGCHFVFCDGSVQLMSYEIAHQIHTALGNRHVGTAVQRD